MIAAPRGRLAGTPPWPPRGGAGDGSAAIVNGRLYDVGMRTQALRVSIGAYSSGRWHVAIIEDHYERGVLINSSIESLSHPETEEELRWNIGLALDKVIELERARLSVPAAG